MFLLFGRHNLPETRTNSKALAAGHHFSFFLSFQAQTIEQPRQLRLRSMLIYASLVPQPQLFFLHLDRQNTDSELEWQFRDLVGNAARIGVCLCVRSVLV